MALVIDIDQLSQAISHATAPAFMLGAVAAFLSILTARLERIADKNRALRSSDDNLDPTRQIGAPFMRRMELLGLAIFLVLSALMTAALLIGAFFAALIGIGHGQVVAILFALALMLLMASPVERAREIRVYMAYVHLE
ncbi:MAG TPA: DUF2721 domain-containing protein [Roseiarcus sp.]